MNAVASQDRQIMDANSLIEGDPELFLDSVHSREQKILADNEFGIAYREGSIPHFRYICAGCKKDDFLSAQSMAGHAAACPEYQSQKVDKSNRPKNHKIKVTKDWWQGHQQRMSEAGLNAFHPSTAYSRASKRQRKHLQAPNPKKRRLNAEPKPLEHCSTPLNASQITKLPAKRSCEDAKEPVKPKQQTEDLDAGLSATGRTRRKVTLNVDYREPEEYTNEQATNSETKSSTCSGHAKAFSSVSAFSRASEYISHYVDDVRMVDSEFDTEPELDNSMDGPTHLYESPSHDSSCSPRAKASPGSAHSRSTTPECMSPNDSPGTSSSSSSSPVSPQHSPPLQTNGGSTASPIFRPQPLAPTHYMYDFFSPKMQQLAIPQLPVAKTPAKKRKRLNAHTNSMETVSSNPSVRPTPTAFHPIASHVHLQASQRSDSSLLDKSPLDHYHPQPNHQQSPIKVPAVRKEKEDDEIFSIAAELLSLASQTQTQGARIQGSLKATPALPCTQFSLLSQSKHSFHAFSPSGCRTNIASHSKIMQRSNTTQHTLDNSITPISPVRHTQTVRQSALCMPVCNGEYRHTNPRPSAQFGSFASGTGA